MDMSNTGIVFWMGESAGAFAFDDLEVIVVGAFKPPPPPPPYASPRAAPPPPGVVALLSFEGTDDGVTSQKTASNGSWVVSIPDARAAHTGAHGLYAAVTSAARALSIHPPVRPPVHRQPVHRIDLR